MEKLRRLGLQERIRQVLVDGTLVSLESMETALQVSAGSGKKLVDVLVQQQAISVEALSTVLGAQLNLPLVDLSRVSVKPEALALVPEAIARRHKVLPVYIDGDTLTVVMDDPGNVPVIDVLTTLARMRIRTAIALNTDIDEAIDRNYRLTDQIHHQVSQVMNASQARAIAESLVDTDAVSQAPVVRTVDMLLTQAVKDRASDVHIEPQEDSLRVRHRIDGVLHEVMDLPLGVHTALVSRIKVLANLNIAERRRPQDGQFSMTVAGRQVDFRVATTETDHGEMAVLRVLDRSLLLFELAQLGMGPAMMEPFQRLLSSPFGMIMVSGPTGSGKTTSLYSAISQLNSIERNIMTIEDPIEYRFNGANQIQVNRQAGVTFAVGLRAIMRLDPDIIMVGEIRDSETANTAIQAALTGHLVLTSIHANDAVGALVRLIDMGVEPFLVTSAVIGSLSQRLVRRVCPYCRSMSKASPAEVATYRQVTDDEKQEFWHGRGCNFCSNTGYLGRTGVFELMTVSEGIRRLVMRGASASELKDQATKDGMMPLRQDGMVKAGDGLTTPSEILRNVFTIL